MQTWSFCIVTFGCKVNQYESHAIRESWLGMGGIEVMDLEAADVVLINSCAVTSRAERDARNAVFRVRRAAPKAHIIFAGCAALTFAKFGKGYEWAKPDLCLDNEEKTCLMDGPWPKSLRSELAQPWPRFRIKGFNRARAVLKVQTGCDHRCTYCIVPKTRGTPLSRSPDETLAEAQRLLAAGHTELVLSGINLAHYGRDRPEYGDFWHLLRFLDAELAPDFADKARLRVSSLEPGQLDERGLETLADCRMVCPHLHISLQHASSSVLRRMGRGHYSLATLETALAKLAGLWPHMGLGADILVGFPGETEDDFRILLEALQRLPLSYAHVFPYSRRPFTAAAQFSGQVQHALKQERAAKARAVVEVQRQRFLERQLGLAHMLVAPVGGDAADGNGLANGINEYYVPCRFSLPLPEVGDRNRRGYPLVEVTPIGLTERGLLVKPVSGEEVLL